MKATSRSSDFHAKLQTSVFATSGAWVRKGVECEIKTGMMERPMVGLQINVRRRTHRSIFY